MKRIITIILIIVSVFVCIPVGAYAAENKTEYVYKDFSLTRIKDDLPDLNYAQYVKTTSLLNMYIVTFAEQYEKNELFVYIYNPLNMKVSKIGKNKIQMLYGNEWRKYDMKYIDEYNNIIKFKIQLPKEFFEMLNKQDRIYQVSGIEIETGKGLKEYEIGGSYKFRGSKNTTKLVDVDTFEVVPLEVHFTTFRNPSVDNVHVYNQLCSVYFSIPNSLLEKYEQRFHGIEVEYEKYQTKPILVTDSAVLVAQLSEANRTVLPFYEDDKATNGTGYYYDSSVPNGVVAYYKETIYRTAKQGWHYNMVTSTYRYPFDDSIFSYFNGMQAIPIIIEPGKDITEETYIESQEVVDKINEFLASPLGKADAYRKIKLIQSEIEKGTEVPKADYYHSLLFEDYVYEYSSSGVWEDSKYFTWGDTPKVRKKITMDDAMYNMVCYGDVNSGWDAFVSGEWKWYKSLMNNESYTNIRPIQIVNMKDVNDMKKSKFSAAYAVDEHDVETIKQYAKAAEAKNETTYLFRVDFGKYEIYAAETRNKINGTVDGHAVMVSETVYMGFDVIDIMFKDENGEIVSYAVVTTPITIAGGLFFPIGDGTNDEDRNAIRILFAVVAVIALIVLYLVFLDKPVRKFVTGMKDKYDKEYKHEYKKRTKPKKIRSKKK